MQRYFGREKIDNKFILNSDDMYHIKTVMRMNNLDNIEVVYEKEVFLCEIINDEIIIKEKIETRKDNIKEIILCIPLLKEQKMDLILQKSTELGVSKIVPIFTERSIIKIEGKEEKKLARWAKICKEAAEQSMRTTIPVVTEIKRLKDLELMDGLKVVCSTTGKNKNIKNFLTTHQNYDKIIIVVGPEGGLSESEENILSCIGFNRISLGSRIMRVETVPMFILSILNYECME